ncbi:bifunctional 2-polyprenyl-6-hydroxyphenol methylase/3-demethylubiquinol 3-O-methyltransferase UbiG [Calothrix sp. PCC 7507]|uniref:class I SAM-dependent methyltransferase n=1 Tax=Calothrix sp. PCC 7507 TaxID=99598 RepID=UPI00029F4B13|nr:class I SAM-dependent methyltransferase [Calothrix sp. PCC 7507]AFY33300.1 Methyltransferase type 11 [Calothrix sp. PCC 7507]
MRYYDRNQIYKPKLAVKVRNRLHQLFLSGLKISSICEVGIGDGHLARYCRENGIEWTGIEPSNQSRNAAIADGFKVYDGMMPVYPEISEEFDAIVASHVIEHLNNVHEAQEFLQASQKILRSHGGRYLILLYPDIEKWGDFFWVDYTHSFVTSKKRIEDMLFDNNWQIIRSEHYLACFFKTSGLLHVLGKIFPYFLLPKKLSFFTKSALQQNVLTIAEVPSTN